MRRSARWHECPPRTALEWGAVLAGVGAADAAAWLAAVDGMPESAAQCWLAAPYHAMLGRDSVRVMPEGMFDWDEAAARALCDWLEPVLAPHGMRMQDCGAALLVTSEDRWDAAPPSFAAIAGGRLPDRHPPGADGGRLMRLMEEIQMHLHMNPLPGREGLPAVSGVWLWGACDAARAASVRGRALAAATRNPALRALCDGRGSRALISEADRLGELAGADAKPAWVVLAGEGRALTLRASPWRALMPHRRLPEPARAGSVAGLDAMLRAAFDAEGGK